ncbi:MAG: hypothetical protein GF398_13230 [Chitinivibrionales bacterium]|nr:hypothetical protein [Chitinivibrionales bacterium]
MGGTILTLVLFLLGTAVIGFSIIRYTQNKVLRLRIIGGIAIVLVVMIGMGTITYISLNGIIADLELIAADDIPVLTNVSDIESKVLVQTIALEKYKSSGAAHYAEEFETLSPLVEKEIAEVEFELADAISRARTSQEREAYKNVEQEMKKIEGEYNEFENTGAQLVSARKAGNMGEVRRLDMLVEKEEIKMRNELSEVISELKEESIFKAEAAHASAERVELVVLLICLLAVAVGIGAGLYIANSIARRLGDINSHIGNASNQVAAASEQMASSSQSLSEGASEQASSLEEVSSSLEEIAAMTKQNANNTQEANALASDANTSAKQSTESMTKMGSVIQNIKKSSDETAKIIKTIDEIAMQTNLLALNAAVEAARAGEAGRGFAVVAEEVRNLAQRSAEAAKNTAQLIEEAQKNSENGVIASEGVGTELQAITEKIEKVAQLVAEVSSANTEQSSGIDQVNEAVAQMDKVTQQNAANSEETASASEELSGQAVNLNDMVVDLTRVIGATQAAGAPSSDQHSIKPSDLRNSRKTDTGEKTFAASRKKTGSGQQRQAIGKTRAPAFPLNEQDLGDF